MNLVRQFPSMRICSGMNRKAAKNLGGNFYSSSRDWESDDGNGGTYLARCERGNRKEPSAAKAPTKKNEEKNLPQRTQRAQRV